MKTRLISSGIGVALALTVLFLHKTILFPIMVAVISLMLVYELLRAANCLHIHPVAKAAVLLYAAVFPLVTEYAAAPLVTFLCVGCLCITFVLQYKKMHADDFFLLLATMLAIPNSMACCVRMEAMDPRYGIIYVVMALGGAWIADSGAYFAGTFLGKRKLCPEISPKKTVEGFIGGIVANGVVFFLFHVIYLFILSHVFDTTVTVNYFVVILIGAVCAVLGTFGDLTASVVKRHYGLKDYGSIMPGHGGMMDRFDSVLLVAPFIYAVVTLYPIFQVN